MGIGWKWSYTLLDLHHTLVEHASINNDGGGADVPADVFIIEDMLYTHGDIGDAAADSIILEWIGEYNSKERETKGDAALSTKPVMRKSNKS